MSSPPGTTAEPWRYPGSRLGLPGDGPGSVAGWGPRLLALALDWLIANLLALALLRDTSIWEPGSGLRWLPLALWALEVWLLTALTGASAGQRLRHLTVLRLDRQRVGVWRSLVRTGMILLVIPPLVFDRDGRGLHDLTAGTVVVHGPR